MSDIGGLVIASLFTFCVFGCGGFLIYRRMTSTRSHNQNIFHSRVANYKVGAISKNERKSSRTAEVQQTYSTDAGELIITASHAEIQDSERGLVDERRPGETSDSLFANSSPSRFKMGNRSGGIPMLETVATEISTSRPSTGNIASKNSNIVEARLATSPTRIRVSNRQ